MQSPLVVTSVEESPSATQGRKAKNSMPTSLKTTCAKGNHNMRSKRYEAKESMYIIGIAPSSKQTELNQAKPSQCEQPKALSLPVAKVTIISLTRFKQ